MNHYLAGILIGLPLFAASQKNEVLILNQKKMIQVEQGQTKSFSLNLERGKAYVIHLEQKGIDVALRLKNEAGKELIFRDSPNGLFGPERIEFTPQNYVDFILTIEPLTEAGNAPKGKCSVQLREAVSELSWKDRKMSPKQMKEDLAVFRAIREKANSGLYRYRSHQSIDSIYSEALNQVKKELSLTDFYKILLVLTDFEGSNHNGTSLPYKASAVMEKDRGYFPFFLKYVDGKMLVNNSNAGIPLGSQVVSINGISDKEFQKRFYKYITTDGYNMTAKKRASAENVFGWLFPFEMGISEFFDIEYKAPGSGEVQTIRLKSISQEENRNNYLARHSAKLDSITDSNIQEKYSFQRINKNTALLNFRIFTMASNAEDPAFVRFSTYLDSVFTLLKKEKIPNLVIDIRNNPGGNDPTYEKVFTYLTNQTFKENKSAFITFNKLPYSQYFKSESEDAGNRKHEVNATNSYLQEVFSVKKENRFYQDQSHNPPYYPDSMGFKGKIYLLIDEHVGSAASHFASLMRGYSSATIVGMETSGGYYGHNGHFPVEYVLPNSKITTRFSIVYVEQDAPVRADQPVGRGIIPDYSIPLLFEDFMNNEDSQMKFVLKLIEESN